MRLLVLNTCFAILGSRVSEYLHFPRQPPVDGLLVPKVGGCDDASPRGGSRGGGRRVYNCPSAKVAHVLACGEHATFANKEPCSKRKRGAIVLFNDNVQHTMRRVSARRVGDGATVRTASRFVGGCPAWNRIVESHAEANHRKLGISRITCFAAHPFRLKICTPETTGR